MTFLLDENFPVSAAAFLRDRGHVVFLSAETCGRGATDGSVCGGTTAAGDSPYLRPGFLPHDTATASGSLRNRCHRIEATDKGRHPFASRLVCRPCSRSTGKPRVRFEGPDLPLHACLRRRSRRSLGKRFRRLAPRRIAAASALARVDREGIARRNPRRATGRNR